MEGGDEGRVGVGHALGPRGAVDGVEARLIDWWREEAEAGVAGESLDVGQRDAGGHAEVDQSAVARGAGRVGCGVSGRGVLGWGWGGVVVRRVGFDPRFGVGPGRLAVGVSALKELAFELVAARVERGPGGPADLVPEQASDDWFGVEPAPKESRAASPGLGEAGVGGPVAEGVPGFAVGDSGGQPVVQHGAGLRSVGAVLRAPGLHYPMVAGVAPMTTVRAGDRRPLVAHLNPVAMARGMWSRRELIAQFAHREVASRYRGSALGLFWTLAQPLLMLGVYTFVFAVVFESRWSAESPASTAEFGLTLFTGLMLFQVFSQGVSRAPRLILDHPNYVKKVVFPLEALPVAALGATMFYAAVSLLVLVAGKVVIAPRFEWEALLYPLAFVPLVPMTLGLMWFLASLGVYLRDLTHVVGVVLQVLMYMTPIFYPIDRVPEGIRGVLQLNPMTGIVETARRTLLWGQQPDWAMLGAQTVVALVVMQLGYAWFMKTKRGFADVL